MKRKILLATLIASVGLMLASCEREEGILSSEGTQKVQFGANQCVSAVTDLDNIDSIKTIATFKSATHLSKGHFGPILGLEVGTAEYVDDSSFTYQTMKVYRQSDPSKYFYVMLTNLNIPDSAVSWSYANDRTNDQLYGRLYSRDGADMYSNKVKMTLTVYKNGRPPKERYVYGRLMTQEDLCDILEIDSFDSNETYDLSQNYLSWAWDMYYDAFVFGLGSDASESASYHTLAGWKNSVSIYDPMLNLTPEQLRQQEIAYVAGYYTQKNHKGIYWMNYVNPVNDASDVLMIYRHNYWEDDDYWKVGVGPLANHSHDLYGFSVRYVFDPFLD